MIQESAAAGATLAAEPFTLEQWEGFFAHLHPLLLHAPIGLLLGSVLLELWSLVSKEATGARRLVNLAFGATAAVAALSGWFLGGNGEYSGVLVDDHRQFGIAAGAAALLVAVLDLFGRSGTAAFARRLAVLAAAVLITMAGHRGGMITHGRSFLSDHAPPWLAPYVGEVREPRAARPAAGDPEASAPITTEPPAPSIHGPLEAVVDAFRARCFECHNAQKTKGKLRLDEATGWTAQVDVESVEDSELLYRLLLPADDVDAMPPKGDRLAPEVIDGVRSWIEAGAPTDELEPLLRGAEAARESTEETLDEVRDATGARIDVIPSLGAEDELLSVDWSHAPEPPSTARVRALAPIAGRVAELSWAGTSAGDDQIAALPGLPRLERVHFERTQVTDAGVATLAARAPSLVYVNLHSSAATGRGPFPEAVEVVLFGTKGRAAADPFASVGTAQPRRILAGDASKRRVALLRETAIGHPLLLWQHEVEALHDLQWLGDTSGGHGRVLLQETWTRVVEIDTATDERLWSYEAVPAEGERVEIHSFQRLDDGTTLIAESGRSRLVFIDAEGRLVHAIALTVSAPDPHRDTRLVRPTPTGTFLVAHEGDGTVREYDRDGHVVWSFAVPLFDRERAPGHGFEAHGNQTFGALRLTSGDTLISTGNGSSFLRVTPAGDIAWRLDQDDLEGVRFAWTTGVQELSNGHLVLGNCHAGPDQPQAVEITPEGEVAWSFRDFERFGDSLSNLVVIERTP